MPKPHLIAEKNISGYTVYDQNGTNRVYHVAISPRSQWALKIVNSRGRSLNLSGELAREIMRAVDFARAG